MSCEQELYWFFLFGRWLILSHSEQHIVSVFREFSRVRQSKQIEWGVYGRVCVGWGHVVGCDTCGSCQDQEEHVRLMTRQRWSGEPDPFPRGGPVHCGFLFRGTKPRCISRSCITSTIPRQATSPPTLSHSSPPPVGLWFSAKANSELAASRSPRSHGHGAHGHSVGLDDLDLQGRTKRPIQSQQRDLDAGRAFCWTLGLNTHEKTGLCARLIASNQPSDINTSCHSEKPCRTKKVLVRVGWDQ